MSLRDFIYSSTVLLVVLVKSGRRGSQELMLFRKDYRDVPRVRGILLVIGTEMADSVLGRDVSPETAETMGRLFQSRRMAFLHTDFLSTFELEMV